MYFDYKPTPNMLWQLNNQAFSSTSQLSKAVRIWVILKTIYGTDTDKTELLNGKELENEFTYYQWRDAFFNDSEVHKSEKTIEDVHDSQCHCAKTIADWIFKIGGISQKEWEKNLQQSTPSSSTKFNYQDRPFAKSRRTIHSNTFNQFLLNTWLVQNSLSTTYYRKLSKLPVLNQHQSQLPQQNELEKSLNFVHQDLSEIVRNYFDPINGIDRFFFHLEYVASSDNKELVDTYTEQLKDIWQQEKINPISIYYQSVSHFANEPTEYIVYPVCIYYYRRAPYLIAYGQNPADTKLGWYNYRLDRIGELEKISWQESRTPQELIQEIQHSNPNKYHPQSVYQELEKAFGFDFYLESDTMLLRFDYIFDEQYVKDTQRHATFKRLSPEEVIQFLQQSNASKIEIARIEDRLTQYPEHAYYTMKYRKQDKDVIWRLRTWGSKVEVLYPSDLRKNIIDDLKAANKVYE